MLISYCLSVSFKIPLYYCYASLKDELNLLSSDGSFSMPIIILSLLCFMFFMYILVRTEHGIPDKCVAV